MDWFAGAYVHQLLCHVSHAAALLLVGLVCTTLLFPGFPSWLGFGGQLTHREVRRVYVTRKYRNQPAVPLFRYADLVAATRRRIASESQYWTVALITVLLCSAINLLSINIWTNILVRIAGFHPSAVAVMVVKFCIIVYKCTRPGVTLATAASVIAFCWAGTVIRMALALTMCIGYALDFDRSSAFSWLFMAPFRAWKGTLHLNGGTTVDVWFVGGADPFLDYSATSPGIFGLTDPAMERDVRDIDEKFAGTSETGSPLVWGQRDYARAKVKMFATDNNVQSRGELTFFRHVEGTLTPDLAQYHHDMSIDAGGETVALKYVDAVNTGITSTTGTVLWRLSYTGRVTNSHMLGGALSGGAHVSAQGAAGHGPLYDLKDAVFKGAVFFTETTTNTSVPETTGDIRQVEGTFTWNPDLTRYLIQYFPIGFTITAVVFLDMIDMFAASLCAFATMSGVVDWFKPKTGELGVGGEESQTSVTRCSTCQGPHYTKYCLRTVSFWGRASAFLGSAAVAGAAGFALFMSSKNFSSLKSVARGLKHGHETVASYVADSVSLSDYSPVSPLCPDSPDQFHVLNALLEVSNEDPRFASKHGFMRVAAFNQILTTIKTDHNALNRELDALFNGVAMTPGNAPSSGAIELDTFKLEALGLTPVMAQSVQRTSKYSIPDHWRKELSLPFPGGATASLKLYKKKSDIGFTACPASVPSASGLYTAPVDPEVTVTDLFVMGWTAIIAMGIPACAVWFVKKFYDRNCPGVPCEVCGLVERDHLNGACRNYDQCEACGKTNHRRGNCLEERVAVAPQFQEEAKKDGFCRYAQGVCSRVDCPFAVHRNFSVLSRAGLLHSIRRNDHVVCIHSDKESPCVAEYRSMLEHKHATYECVYIPTAPKGNPSGTLTIPPANIYYTTVEVYSPWLAMLNLRAPAFQEEGANDRANFRYHQSARASAHREDRRGARGASGYSKRTAFDSNRVVGSDMEAYLDFISREHDSDDWLDFARRTGTFTDDEFDSLVEEVEQFTGSDRYGYTGGGGGRYAVQRAVVRSLYNDGRHKVSDPVFARALDKYMDEEAKKAAPSPTFCHDFANYRCNHGPSCKFPHVPYDQIPPADRVCAYGAKGVCVFDHCVFKRGEELRLLNDNAPRTILKKSAEPSMAPEATVKRNPIINHPSATPVEIYHNDSNGVASALYAWKLSDNNGKPCFLSPYHVFGCNCYGVGDKFNVSFRTTKANQNAFKDLRCSLVSTTHDKPAHKTNEWKIALCVISVEEPMPADLFPGIRALAWCPKTIGSERTRVIIYPPIMPGAVSAGEASFASQDLLTHDISMPEKFNGSTIFRCGRLLVSSEGPVGVHVSGDEASQTNFAFPLSRAYLLLSGSLTAGAVTDLPPNVTEQSTVRARDLSVLLGLDMDLLDQPRPVAGPYPEDVLHKPCDQIVYWGTCKRISPPKSGFILDYWFYRFMVNFGSRYPVVLSSYRQHILSHTDTDSEVHRWAATAGAVEEGLYDTRAFFTHVPARYDPRTLDFELKKFFRPRLPDDKHKQLCFFAEMYLRPIFDRVHASRPYRVLTYEEALEDLEAHGNEYKSSGAGVTKNQAFRDCSFMGLLDTALEDPNIGSVHCVANKVELRTIGKPQRQFVIQDPVSYAASVRWLRWFSDAIVELSISGDGDHPFFNTFSPFGCVPSLVRRGCERLHCTTPQLWFWCFDGRKSECNDFRFVKQFLGRWAIAHGADADLVCHNLLGLSKSFFADLNRGQVFGPNERTQGFNTSGFFGTTIVTSTGWAVVTLAACTHVSTADQRILPVNAGDDGLFLSNFDPTCVRQPILDFLRNYGFDIEFQGQPCRFLDATAGDFTFCSVTFDRMERPFMIPGKRSSALMYRPEAATDTQRMSALDSYWLTSVYDPQLGPVITAYREYFASVTGTKPHVFPQTQVDRLYCDENTDPRYFLDTVDMQAEAAQKQALKNILDRSEAQCLTVDSGSLALSPNPGPHGYCSCSGWDCVRRRFRPGIDWHDCFGGRQFRVINGLDRDQTRPFAAQLRVRHCVRALLRYLPDLDFVRVMTTHEFRHPGIGFAAIQGALNAQGYGCFAPIITSHPCVTVVNGHDQEVGVPSFVHPVCVPDIGAYYCIYVAPHSSGRTLTFACVVLSDQVAWSSAREIICEANQPFIRTNFLDASWHAAVAAGRHLVPLVRRHYLSRFRFFEDVALIHLRLVAYWANVRLRFSSLDIFSAYESMPDFASWDDMAERLQEQYDYRAMPVARLLEVRPINTYGDGYEPSMAPNATAAAARHLHWLVFHSDAIVSRLLDWNFERETRSDYQTPYTPLLSCARSPAGFYVRNPSSDMACVAPPFYWDLQRYFSALEVFISRGPNIPQGYGRLGYCYCFCTWCLRIFEVPGSRAKPGNSCAQCHRDFEEQICPLLSPAMAMYAALLEDHLKAATASMNAEAEEVIFSGPSREDLYLYFYDQSRGQGVSVPASHAAALYFSDTIASRSETIGAFWRVNFYVPQFEIPMLPGYEELLTASQAQCSVIGREDRSARNEHSPPCNTMATIAIQNRGKNSAKNPAPAVVIENSSSKLLNGGGRKKGGRRAAGPKSLSPVEGKNHQKQTGRWDQMRRKGPRKTNRNVSQPLSLRARVAVANGLVRSTAGVRRDPASRNFERFVRIVACPDELENLDLEQHNLPIYPSESTARRHSHVAATIMDTSLPPHVLVCNVPGQTRWVARIKANCSFADAGSLICINAGREDMHFLADDCGLPVSYGQTRALTPGMHMGIMLGSLTDAPLAPGVVSYTSTDASTAYGVYYPMTDGAGNYWIAFQAAVTQFMGVMIGDVTPVTGNGSPSATPWINPTLFSQVINGSTKAVYPYPITLSTGAPARSILNYSGYVHTDPGAGNFFPYNILCANLRIYSEASALKNKYSITSYALAAGREGPFKKAVDMVVASPASTGLIDKSVLASNSRQTTTGQLNPEVEEWTSVNLASRTAECGRASLINGLEYAGVDIPPSSLESAAGTQQNVGSAQGKMPSNPEGGDWHDYTVSYSWFYNGATDGSLIPAQIMGRFACEFHLPSDTGFQTSEPLYFFNAPRALARINTYPTLATAHSFKNFFSSVFSRGKDAARSAIGTAGAVLKPLAIGAAKNFLEALPGLLVA